MPTILAIPGSLRRGSYNASLLRAAAEVAPSSVKLEMATLRGIPLYDADEEAASGVPEVVQALKERIASADGVLVSTPEYNASIPGVLKNAFDWISRPGSDVPRVLGNRKLALFGATPGRGGTIMAQAAWLPIFRALGVDMWFGPRLFVSNAAQVFDGEGKLVDASIEKQLRAFMEGFTAYLSSG